MNDWMIFTDLDGTLLDHNDYSFAQALPALEKIRKQHIPLIINSSKTYAEIKEIRKKMLNHWAFSVENGAVVYLPEGELYGKDNNMKQIILGTPIVGILKILQDLREQYGFSFKGFSDFSIEELIAQTGLTETQVKQAKQRLASEPLKWLGSQEELISFEQMLINQNLQLIQGGRFLHVMGKNDKSQAMAWILNEFKKETKILTIALGDSQNDLRMLEQADFSGVIRKQNGSYLQLNKTRDRVIYSQNTAPKGWQEVMDQLFVKLNIG